MYNDEYPTCSRTYLGLRIFHDSLSPKEITDLLRVTPSLTREKEETKPSCWTLSTEDFVDSLDLRRHIDWLLDRLEQCRSDLRQLQKEASIDVCCYWRSKNGHGGPTLSPPQLRRLADFELEIWIDFYR